MDESLLPSSPGLIGVNLITKDVPFYIPSESHSDDVDIAFSGQWAEHFSIDESSGQLKLLPTFPLTLNDDNYPVLITLTIDASSRDGRTDTEEIDIAFFKDYWVNFFPGKFNYLGDALPDSTSFVMQPLLDNVNQVLLENVEMSEVEAFFRLTDFDYNVPSPSLNVSLSTSDQIVIDKTMQLSTANRNDEDGYKIAGITLDSVDNVIYVRDKTVSLPEPELISHRLSRLPLDIGHTFTIDSSFESTGFTEDIEFSNGKLFYVFKSNQVRSTIPGHYSFETLFELDGYIRRIEPTRDGNTVFTLFENEESNRLEILKHNSEGEHRVATFAETVYAFQDIKLMASEERLLFFKRGELSFKVLSSADGGIVNEYFYSKKIIDIKPSDLNESVFYVLALSNDARFSVERLNTTDDSIEILSGSEKGNGPLLDGTFTFVVHESAQVAYLTGRDKIFAVDLKTGNRSILQ